MELKLITFIGIFLLITQGLQSTEITLSNTRPLTKLEQEWSDYQKTGKIPTRIGAKPKRQIHERVDDQTYQMMLKDLGFFSVRFYNDQTKELLPIHPVPIRRNATKTITIPKGFSKIGWTGNETVKDFDSWVFYPEQNQPPLEADFIAKATDKISLEFKDGELYVNGKKINGRRAQSI